MRRLQGQIRDLIRPRRVRRVGRWNLQYGRYIIRRRNSRSLGDQARFRRKRRRWWIGRPFRAGDIALMGRRGGPQVKIGRFRLWAALPTPKDHPQPCQQQEDQGQQRRPGSELYLGEQPGWKVFFVHDSALVNRESTMEDRLLEHRLRFALSRKRCSKGGPNSPRTG